MLPLEWVDWTWDWTEMLRDALRLTLELECQDCCPYIVFLKGHYSPLELPSVVVNSP